jgi:hypothetical protein
MTMVSRVNMIYSAVCIAFVVAAGVALLWQSFRRSQVLKDIDIDQMIGSRVSVSGVDFSRAKKTVVLGMSTKCPFCSISAPFMRHAVDTAHQHNDTVIAVFPQPVSEGRSFTSEKGLAVDQVISSPIGVSGIRIVPYILIIDSSGILLGGGSNLGTQSMQDRILGQI